MEDSAPAHVDSPFYFNFPPPKKANGALVNISQAELGHDGKTILSHVNVDLHPGTRIGLLGPNGAGKSTLINSLTGDLDLINGVRVYGENLKIGYFAQHQLEVLDLQASPFLHIQRISPTATDQQIRNFLGGFDFHNDKALDPIKDFSGGEKARVALAMIVWQKPNLLLLDEPTNHLDLEMRHALTMALQGYQGALVVISHDRHLLRNTVDEFFLVAEGAVREFDGDLNDYQKWLKNYSRITEVVEPAVIEAPVDKKLSRQESAEKRKKRDPITKQIKQIEAKIEKLQKSISDIEATLSDGNIYTEDNKLQLKDVLAKQTEVKKNLSDHEEQWLEFQDQLEMLS